MAKGFLSGAIWGAVVAVAGAGAISVATGPVGQGALTPEAGSVDVPPGSGFNGARDDQAAQMPGTQPGTQAPPLPKVEAPTKDDLAGMAGADVEPGARPEAAGGQAGLAAPSDAPGDAPGVSAAQEGAIARNDAMQVTAPEAPEMEPSISTEPAQPQPPVSEETAGLVTGTQDQGAIAEAEPGGTAPDVQSTPPQEPSAIIEDEQAAENTGESPVESTGEAPVDSPADEAREEVVIRIEPQAESAGTDAAPEASPERESAEVTTGEAAAPVVIDESENATVESTSQAEADAVPVPEVAMGAGIGRPASTMPKANDTVKIGRLPRVGADTETTQQAAEPAGAVNTEMTLDASDMPPVKRYAEPFQGDENKPKMSIVLIDDGDGPVGFEALTTFPYPLSFAVDTSRPDAEDAMAKYRAAGFEVLAMVRLPAGATPVDVEQALPVMLQKVPEAVGVMEAPDDGIQFDRSVSDQVAQILSESGHGLLLYSKGLNTAQKLAAKNGVPSATIFRDFDSQGQKAGAIRRFLNHGALKAESENGVVMVGRLRPDTVTALLLWGLEDRARQVALAPVTALLKDNR
ncbi:divergent polysaccharide deacteylase family protein [Rhodalgimonas zhirmunskyi]|uniref:Divergent polysaccharide deacetylase family protein n=1 Tax=Rhodalgimonas zhirmunskyi TaxID=2964767 RepID=A0AAJ1U7U5_9RHOB|nr:divergent polysaccharide deacetylase family protein [Rhodoalgimonas zhirmunskyi]MDQ2092683.1 divergent polysaccharide deacetylase family protein [Rhodoalgimonas zhirmunskyi]